MLSISALFCSAQYLFLKSFYQIRNFLKLCALIGLFEEKIEKNRLIFQTNISRNRNLILSLPESNKAVIMKLEGKLLIVTGKQVQDIWWSDSITFTTVGISVA